MQIIGRHISYIFTILATFSLIFLPRHTPTSDQFQIGQTYSSMLGVIPNIKRNLIRPSIRPDIAPIISTTPLEDKILYPLILSNVVRINNISGSSVGSGVIIWSGFDSAKIAHTFILTNRHVLPAGTLGTVEVFSYLNFRDLASVTTYPCLTVMQNDEADLALVEVISTEVIASTASIISSDEYQQMPMYTDLFIVGCGLANPPFISSAKVVHFEDSGLLLNGFSVWGFSGGGVFDRCGHLVAVSCQIGMAVVGTTTHAVTNMSMSIPINVICKWLLASKYKFIVNPELGSVEDILKTKKFY